MNAQTVLDIINKFGDAGWRWAIDGPLPDPQMKWKASVEKGTRFNIQWGPDLETAIVRIVTTTAI
jgi:hypothetical protein